jgi:hypothetical protein
VRETNGSMNVRAPAMSFQAARQPEDKQGET